jgi:agmatine deiminase
MPAANRHMPAEWAPHAACFVAWPYLDDWGTDLAEARRELAGMCRAIADVDPASGRARGERLEVLVRNRRLETSARRALRGLPARFHRLEYGDIWLRDTTPLFIAGPHGATLGVRFRFNGWGSKYELPGDADLAARLGDAVGVPQEPVDLVCEGGALDVDGEGTCLTTRDCLLNPNRNPGLSERKVAEQLEQALGLTRVIWLDGLLTNDHTDGHVDTLARFIGPGRVVCMEPARDDPNAAVLRSLEAQLRTSRDAHGRRFEVHTIPSPGRVLGEGGRIMPASYCNFYIANGTVVVPTYGSPQDGAAVEAIAKLFPRRRAVGAPARAILTGGGAFHCITQQWPACAAPPEAP